MKPFLLFAFSAFLGLVQAQAPQYGSLVGLQFQTSSLTPVIVSPNDGEMVTLSPGPASADAYMSGNSTVDQSTQTYYYIRGASPQLIRVDLSTGNKTVVGVQSPIGGDIPICSIQFNPADGNIYGLNMKNSQLRLMKMNPSTGQMTVVTPNPISGDMFSTGDATLDTINGNFYYTRGFGGSQLVKVNIYTGQSSSVTVSNPNNAIQSILNLQWNHADQTLYGLNFTTGALRLAKLNTTNGVVTLISQGAISSDGFEQGNCALDPVNGLYHYVRGFGNFSDVLSVDLQTGLAVKNIGASVNQGNPKLVNIEFLGDVDPVARYTADSDCSLNVDFFNQSLGSTYLWDFGDGNSSTSRNPEHQYAAAGTYNVSCVVSANGLTETIVQSIEVKVPLNFSLGNDTVMIPGDTILLTAPINSGPYAWSTGETSSMLTVTTPGVYTVEVNGNDCPSQATIQIDTAIFFAIAGESQTTASTQVNDTLRLHVGLNSISDTVVRMSYTIDHHDGANFYLGHKVQDGLSEPIENQLELAPYESGSFEISYFGQEAFNSHVVLTLYNENGLPIRSIDLIGEVASNSLSVNESISSRIRIPNPIQTGRRLSFDSQENYQIFNLSGQLISEGRLTHVQMPQYSGMYLFTYGNERVTLLVQD